MSAFVKEPYTKYAWFDTKDFVKAVKIGIRALDDIIDENANRQPLVEQRDMSLNYRNVGLGVFGYANMLMKMGIVYGSSHALALTDEIFDYMFRTAVFESNELAKTRGVFPKYSDVVWDSEIMKYHFAAQEIESLKKTGLRNCSLLSIAPAGTIATVLGCSSGCEPEFSMEYTRKTESASENQPKYYKVYCNSIKEYLEVNPNERGKKLPNYFIGANQVNWKDRVKMQGVMQTHIDTAISSTVNLPNETTLDDVEQLFLYAWKCKLKGITIFRDGCKKIGVLTTTPSASTSTSDVSKEETEKIKKEEKEEKEELTLKESEKIKSVLKSKGSSLKRGDIIDADDNVIGLKRKLSTGCGSLHCTAYFDPDTGELLETYFNKGSTGGCVSGDTEFFNGIEWKKISEYKNGEKVLQYNKNGVANLVEPINYIVNDNVKTLKQFKNKYVDMILSDDHRMYLYTNYRKYDMGIRKELHDEIITVKDWIDSGKKERHMLTTFNFGGVGIPLTDDEIRLCVMIYADGHICCNKTEYICVEVSKDRKKERVRELLTKCGIQYKEFTYEYKPNYIAFKFYSPKNISNWVMDKQFSYKWYSATNEQFKLITNEIIYWDGSTGKGNRGNEYFSSKKEEIDFIQFAFSSIGKRATISNNGKENTYRIRTTNLINLDISKTIITNVNTLDNKSYCFTVPSSMLVLRHNNKIFITGNCNQFMIGLSRTISLLARAGVDIYTIVDQLSSCGVCPSYAVRSATKHDTSKGSSCPTAIGNALLDMYNEMQEKLMDNDDFDENEPQEKPLKIKQEPPKKVEISKKTSEVVSKEDFKCPECGENSLAYEGGCITCKACGWSRCG